MRIVVDVVVVLAGLFLCQPIEVSLTKSLSVDSLGACQGVSFLNGRAYLYGDREVGVIRAYTVGSDTLTYAGSEIRLTQNGQNVINHPTGIAWQKNGPTFIGNSIRPGNASLNAGGTGWRAVIHAVNWTGLLRTGTLDGNLLNTIEDDACIQGTRPELVYYQNKPYVATADYGDRANEVRLYDPVRLATAKKTSEPGVLVKKFTCSPWVQNLHWIPEKGVLILIQNQIEGRRWRFTFVDFPKSVDSGKEVVLKTIDVDKADELEGFTLLNGPGQGLAVTSSQRNNVHVVHLNW